MRNGIERCASYRRGIPVVSCLESPPDWVESTTLVTAENGLHARPCVKITQLAKSFESSVEIRCCDRLGWVNAKSPSSVMKMRAAKLSRIFIRAYGPDSADAVDALVGLVDRGFDG